MNKKYTPQKYLNDEVWVESFQSGQSGLVDWLLVYPSPYSVGMSSLGFQTIYKVLLQTTGVFVDRYFLEEGNTNPLSMTYEKSLNNFEVLAFSVSYELEINGFFEILTHADINPVAKKRTKFDPLIIVGGPLTFSNPLSFAPFSDIIIMGEAEHLLADLNQWIYEYKNDKNSLLKFLATQKGFFIPAIHGEHLPGLAKAPDHMLPAKGIITTPHAVLSNMFLTEVERGCSRGCSFCVMRRSTNDGMRKAIVDNILNFPEHVKKVGLVGAAVSDHPQITEILEALVARKCEFGLSSLRADRLTPKFVELLMLGGYKTITVASDGASEKLRIQLEKKIRSKHLLEAARLTNLYKIKKLKVYMMVGAPGEEDADINELIEFSKEQNECLGHSSLVLGIAPFVAKKNTPLDKTPFVGIKESEKRIRKIQKALKQVADVRPVSSRWAFIEYCLAQGGFDSGLAAYEAYKKGGGFQAMKESMSQVGLHESWAKSYKVNRKSLNIV